MADRAACDKQTLYEQVKAKETLNRLGCMDFVQPSPFRVRNDFTSICCATGKEGRDCRRHRNDMKVGKYPDRGRNYSWTCSSKSLKADEFREVNKRCERFGFSRVDLQRLRMQIDSLEESVGGLILTYIESMERQNAGMMDAFQTIERQLLKHESVCLTTKISSGKLRKGSGSWMDDPYDDVRNLNQDLRAIHQAGMESRVSAESLETEVEVYREKLGRSETQIKDLLQYVSNLLKHNVSATEVDYQYLLLEKTSMDEEVHRLNLIIRKHEEEKLTVRNENEWLSENFIAVKSDLSQLQASLETTSLTKTSVEEVNASNEVGSVTMELEELRIEREKMQQDLTSLKQKLKKVKRVKDGRINKLELAFAESKSKVAELEESVLEIEREKNIVARNLEQSVLKIKECEITLSNLHEECATIKTDFITAEKRVSELETKKELYEKRVNELERDLSSTKERNVALKQYTSSMEATTSEKERKCKELSVENSQKQFELDRLKAKTSQLQLELATASEEKTTLKAQLEESRRNYQRQVSLYSSTELQMNEASTKLESYKTEITEKTKMIEIIRSEKNNIEASFRSASHESQERESEVKVLRKSKEDFERMSQSAEAKNANLEKALEASRLENEELKQKMIDSHNNICSLTESSSEAAKINSKNVEELVQLQKQVLDQQGDCRENQEKSDRLREENKSLKGELSASRKKKDELENELRSSQDELEELKARVKELQNLIKTEEAREQKLKEDLDTSEKKAGIVLGDYEACSKEKKDLERELSELKILLSEMKYQVETLEIEKSEKCLLQEKFESADQKYKELLRRSEKEKSEQSSVKNLNEHFKEENLQLRVDLGREKEEKETLEIKNRQIERIVEKVRQALSQKEAKFQESRQEVSIYKEEVTKKEVKIQEVTAQITVLTEHVRKLKEEAGEEKGELDSVEKEKDFLKNENAKLDRQLRASCDKLMDFEKAIETEKKNSKEKGEEVVRLENDISSLRKKLRQAEEEVRLFSMELEKMKKELLSFHQQKTANSSEAELIRQELVTVKSERIRITNVLHENRTEQTKIRLDLEEARSSLASTKSNNEELSERIRELTSEGSEFQITIRRLKQELEGSSRDLTASKEEIRNLEKEKEKELRQKKSVEYELQLVSEKLSANREVRRAGQGSPNVIAVTSPRTRTARLSVRERTRTTSASEVTTLGFDRKPKTPEKVRSTTEMVVSPKRASREISIVNMNVAAPRETVPREMTVTKDQEEEDEVSKLEGQRRRRQERNDRLNKITIRSPLD